MSERLRYFWFWIRAYNRHGIHSPFVYELMEKAVFNQQGVEYLFMTNKRFREFSYFNRKRMRLLIKLLNFYKPNQLVWMGNNHQNMFDFLEGIFQEIWFLQIKPDDKFVFENELKSTDWLIVDVKSIDLELIYPIKNRLSNDSKVFFLETDKDFFRLINEWKGKVELDFFFLKILLFRKEMKPQNFKLRS